MEFATEPATEQEQMVYEKALQRSLETLHSDGTGDQVAKLVLESENPVDGIGEAVFMLVRRAENTVQGVDGPVMVQLAEDLIEEIVDLMVEGGHMTEDSITPEFGEQIVAKAYEMYLGDKDQRGQLDYDAIREDVKAAEQIPGINAMSNQTAGDRKALLQRKI